MRECTFISGLCQSRKTQKTLDTIAHLVSHVPQLQRRLVLYITQAGSTLNAFQVIQRFRTHDTLGHTFPCLLRATCDGSPAAGNTAVVDFYHKKNTAAMLKIAARSRWDHVICIIDEADQGAATGFRGRLNVLQELDAIVPQKVRLHAIFVTATVPNLCKLFNTIAKNVVVPEASKPCFVSNLLNGTQPVQHHFVTPHHSYVSMDWFYQNKRVCIVPGVSHLQEQSKTKKSLTKEVAMEKLHAFTNRQRRLVLISFTNSKEEQSKVADSLIASGDFDIAICLNSENAKNYMVHYGRCCGWAIPYGSMMRAASRGQFAKHVTDNGEIIDTGIETAHDISLSHVLFTGLLTNEDFARASGYASPTVRPQLIALRNYLTAKRPVDYPNMRNARIAIIGGNMLSRGITIQDPNIGFTCTAFVFMDTSGCSTADAGASHTQKAGRALGNMLDFFEGGAATGRYVSPYMVISAPLFISALSNEQLTYQKGTENDNAIIDVKTYITHEEYRKQVQNVQREVNFAS